MNTYKKMDRFMYILGISFLAIPASIFLFFWFKWYIGVSAIIILVFLSYKLIKNIKYKTLKEYESIYDIKKWCVIIFILLIINILSGTGGFTYQNWDHNARNAVMHDLIDYDYPVKYNYEKEGLVEKIGEQGYLSYYFSYWLVSSSIGKVIGFYGANVCLFVYQFIGLLLFMYFLSRFFSSVKIWYALIFLCFSGLDFVEFLVNYGKLFPLGTHIDCYVGSRFIISSFITQLFWVFNQSVPIWIIVMMYFNEKDNTNIGLLMFFALLFSPLPSLGFAALILMNILFGKYKDSNKDKLLDRIKKCFVKNNYLSLILIALILIFYLNNVGSQEKGIVWLADYGIEKSELIRTYISFLFGNIIIIGLLLNNKINRKYIIYVSLCLLLLSQFYLGIGADLLSRASIPLLLFQFILIIDRLSNKDTSTTIHICLIVYLIISSIAPLQEIYRSIDYTKFSNYNYINNYNDFWYTYGNENNDYNYTYIQNFSSKYDKNSFAFKYILK